MNRAIRFSFRGAAPLLLGIATATAASAQDGFGQPVAQAPLPQTQDAPQSRSDLQPPRDAARQAMPTSPTGAGAENQDFGVAPTRQLRPTEQLHGPTPTSIPGARVIGTQALAQLLQGGQGRTLVLHLYGRPEGIPGAIAAGPAAQGGSFDDDVQQGFGQFLRQATGGDTARPIVLYCGGTQCWGSYNGALRAVALGYRDVAWYRGGIEAWRQAGLPVQPVGGLQGAGPAR